MKPPDKRSHRLLQIVGTVVGIGAVVGLSWSLHSLVGGKPDRVNRTVQTVQIIRPPPPPPEEQPPPPPDQPKEEVPLDSPEPKDAADDPTPSEQLGLDADGTAGGDAFGLAAHKGGRDLAGSGGSAFAWYTGRLRDHVDQRLGSDSRLKTKKFTVTVKIWIQNDGHIQDVQLTSTTGNRDLDQVIQASLAAVGNIGEPPPIEMPQPVSLKIVSRI